MKKEKSALQDIKQISEIFKDMAKRENIRFSILFILSLFLIAVALAALTLGLKWTIVNVFNMYQGADVGNKLSVLTAVATSLITLITGGLSYKAGRSSANKQAKAENGQED